MIRIAYLAPQLPKRSETFVYRELLGLRAAGRDVVAATLHPPDRGLGDPALDALAAAAVPVYGAGPLRLLRDALAERLAHPLRATGTLVSAWRDAFRADDLPTWKARLKVPGQAFAALALARRLRPLGVTHLHAHFAHSSATVAMYAARQLGIPFSFTGHAVDLFRDRALLRAKLDRAAFIACISQWHREWYRSLQPRPDPDYPVVRCGVDPVAYAPAPPASRAGALRILALGRLVPKKGFDTLLRALPLLEGLPVRVVLAGDGPEKNALAALVRDLALADRVTMPGPVNPGEVPALLRDADAFVLPCRTDAQGDRDGIPVVLMEAMAAGVCVVSGDLPTLRELVEQDVTGLLVPPDDPAALAGALLRLAGDTALRERLREGGRRRIEQEFSLAANVARIEQAIARVAR